MKHFLAFTIVLHALLVWQNSLVADDTRYEAEDCARRTETPTCPACSREVDLKDSSTDSIA